MWGIATGNAYLEGLGRLQTGVVTRSINEYFLMKDSNTNHPPDFVKNKVRALVVRAMTLLTHCLQESLGVAGMVTEAVAGCRHVVLSTSFETPVYVL